MSGFRTRSSWIGLLLVVSGTIWFLDAWDVLPIGQMWAALPFGLAGIGLGVIWAQDRQAWWASIPASVLLGIAGVIVWEEYVPPLNDEWGGAIFLAAMGAGFLAVYARGQERWWALIPGGVMVSLAVLVGATTVLPELQATALLFGGLALTFILVAALPPGGHRRRWALIPAIPLGALALVFAVGSTDTLRLLEYVWPVALIGGGLLIMWRAAVDRSHGGQR